MNVDTVAEQVGGAGPVVDVDQVAVAQAEAALAALGESDERNAKAWQAVLARAGKHRPEGDAGGVVTPAVRRRARAELQRVMTTRTLRLHVTGAVQESFGTQFDQLWQEASDTQRDALLLVLARAASAGTALLTWPRGRLLDELQLRWDPTVGLPSPRGANMGTGPRVDSRHSDYLCLLLRVTTTCNFNCVHCRDLPARESGPTGPDVLWPLLRQALGEQGPRIVDIVWQGGEPTTLGLERMRQLLAMQQAATAPGVIVRNVLRTNATLMTEELAKFLASHGFRVSLSLDAPAELHDSHAGLDGPGPTDESVARGVALLREAGVPPGALIVVTQEVIARGAASLVELCDYLEVTELGLLVPRRNGGDTAPGMVAECASFLDSLRAEIADSGSPLRVRQLDSLTRVVQGRPAHNEARTGTCLGHYFAVEPDGSVYHYTGSRPDPSRRLGSLLAEPFGALRSRPAPADDLAQEAGLTREDCPWSGSCAGWCPLEHDARQWGARQRGARQSGARQPGDRHPGSPGSRGCGLAPLSDSETLRMGDQSPGSVSRGGL